MSQTINSAFPFKLNEDIFSLHDRGLPACNVIVHQRFKLAYVPIPKNTCSALKILFFNLRTGTEFAETFDRVHTKFDYKASDFELFSKDRDYFKFLVVRDPLERFVSAFNNRVKFYGEISENWFRKNGHGQAYLDRKFTAKSLRFDPDINEFASRIEDYLNVSTRIQHHFVPQHYFFNARPDVFDKVYTVGQLNDLLADLQSITKTPLTLRRVQETKGLENMARVSDLSLAEISHLTAFYAKDYECLAPYL